MGQLAFGVENVGYSRRARFARLFDEVEIFLVVTVDLIDRGNLCLG